MSPSRCIIYTNNFHLFWSYFITNDKDLLAALFLGIFANKE